MSKKEDKSVHKKRKKLPMEKMDFYRFQWRAKKHKEITDARERKKKDMHTVDKMRKDKKFKTISRMVPGDYC